jgi:hypothetical protein
VVLINASLMVAASSVSMKGALRALQVLLICARLMVAASDVKCRVVPFSTTLRLLDTSTQILTRTYAHMRRGVSLAMPYQRATASVMTHS